MGTALTQLTFYFDIMSTLSRALADILSIRKSRFVGSQLGANDLDFGKCRKTMRETQLPQVLGK
jgi:hypothetical protein